MLLIQILGNFIAPVFSGTILLIFAVYFYATKSLTTVASRYFFSYLIFFGLFLLLRPVQLFLGDHPLPLIINIFRSFLLLAVAAPALVCANLGFIIPIKRRTYMRLEASGILLALVYSVFLLVSQEGIFVAFRLGALPAYEPLLGVMAPPYYGREVTILTYVIAGGGISLSGLHLLSWQLPAKRSELLQLDKFLYFSIGSILLGISIILGSLLKLWHTYYLASFVCSLLAGKGILIDINELKARIGITVPYMREELSQIIRFQPKRSEDLRELIKILEYNPHINTVLIIESRCRRQEEQSCNIIDLAFSSIEPHLMNVLDEKSFFFIPISRYKMGLCLFLDNKDDPGKKALALCENISEKVRDRDITLSIGIGRTGRNALDLPDSYNDAVTAQAYAVFFQKSQIIHIEDIQDVPRTGPGFFFDTDDLSIALKAGKKEETLMLFDQYFSGIMQYTEGNREKIRLFSLQLIGSVIQDAISVGLSPSEISEQGNTYYSETLRLQDPEALRSYLRKILAEVVSGIQLLRKNRQNQLVLSVKEYIEEHVRDDITGKIIAGEIGLSYTYLIHIFKKEAGLSLNEYIVKTRVNLAKKILLDTDMSITEAAFEAGFNDSNYFSTLFKKHVGMTPSQFRKKS